MLFPGLPPLPLSTPHISFSSLLLLLPFRNRNPSCSFCENRKESHTNGLPIDVSKLTIGKHWLDLENCVVVAEHEFGKDLQNRTKQRPPTSKRLGAESNLQTSPCRISDVTFPVYFLDPPRPTRQTVKSQKHICYFLHGRSLLSKSAFNKRCE